MSEEHNKYYIWQSFFIGLAAAIGLYAGLHIQLPKENNKKENQDNILNVTSTQKWSDVISFINARYIDSISTKDLTEKAISGLLNNLDPYSDYYSPEEAEALNNEINGDYTGIGIECIQLNNKVFISAILPSSPAALNPNIKTASQILQINHENVDTNAIAQQSVMEKIKNAKDTLTLQLRHLNGEISTVVLTKKEIPVSSVDLAYSPAPGILYVKLSIVGEHSYRELMDALDQFYTKQNCKKLILDLRDNSGGLVHVAADILNQFVLEKEQLLFKTKNKNTEKEYRALGRPFFKFDKLVVLVNENTASASEIISGSLQDIGAAYIIGSNTLGKGTLLEQFTLSDRSIIRMAVGRFYLPSGRCPQKRYGHIEVSDSTMKSHFVTFKGRQLINEAGISPDLYVNDSLSNLINSDQRLACDKLALRFIIENANKLPKTIQQLNIDANCNFWIEANLKPEIIDSSIKRSRSFWIGTIKNTIAYQLFGRAKECELSLLNDSALNAAIAYLKSKK